MTAKPTKQQIQQALDDFRRTRQYWMTSKLKACTQQETSDTIEAVLINALAALDQMQTGWIDATEEQPTGGDSRKLCWIVTEDGMAHWGVRYWNSVDGAWYNGSRKETDTVTHWKEGPENPAYGEYK